MSEVITYEHENLTVLWLTELRANKPVFEVENQLSFILGDCAFKNPFDVIVLRSSVVHTKDMSKQRFFLVIRICPPEVSVLPFLQFIFYCVSNPVQKCVFEISKQERLCCRASKRINLPHSFNFNSWESLVQPFMSSLYIQELHVIVSKDFVVHNPTTSHNFKSSFLY